MFTGFATENTPAIQVWEFVNTIANVNTRVSLTDDCAPTQFFKTGGSTALQVYLPSYAIEGRIIKLINAKYGTSNTLISIFSADRRNGGTNGTVYSLYPGQSLELCYTKQAISSISSTFYASTGWISLNQSPMSAVNYGSTVFGLESRATGIASFATGGNNNADGAYAGVVGGSSNTASGDYSGIVGGFNHTSSGTGSAILGGNGHNVSGNYAVAVGGAGHLVNSANSIVLSGSYGSARSIIGNTISPASNGPIDAVYGVQQTAALVLGAQTTDATVTTLRSNTSVAGTTNQVILPNNSAYTFQGTVIANITGGGNTSGWKFEGVIKRGANAASTTLVAAVTPTVIAQDVGAATWVVAVTADTTNGGIKVAVTGAAATTIRWVCKIETTEVTY